MVEITRAPRPRLGLQPTPQYSADDEAETRSLIDGPDEAPVDARPVMRSPMREEDPRVRAARRAAELRDHGDGFDSDDLKDDFYVDPRSIPEGWDYEWKRQTLLNQEDPAYNVQVAMGGWEPVPASRHPAMMPGNSVYKTIDRKGMRLYERPKEISEDARNKELRKARNQVRQKEASLSGATEGQFQRQDANGVDLVKVKKNYEHVPIPD